MIDTSAVIKYLNGTFPKTGIELLDRIVDEESNISFISAIELQVWMPEDPADLLIYQQFVAISNIIGISDGIISETINIRKTSKIKLPDALIAATAIANDLTLIADNDKDFRKVPALKCLNPKNS